jgi:rod shape-determining protein MreD
VDGLIRSLQSIALCFAFLVVQSMSSRLMPTYPWAPQMILPVIIYFGLLREVNVARSMLVGFGLCVGFFVVQLIASRFLPAYSWAPQLLLPVVVYYGLLQEVNIARGMMVAFVSGYLLDLFAGNPMSLHTFIQCATFLVARGLGLRLFLRNVVFQAALAFVASLAAQGTSFALRAIFEDNPSPFEATASTRLYEAMSASAIMTALAAPIVFAIVARIESTETARRDEGSVKA